MGKSTIQHGAQVELIKFRSSPSFLINELIDKLTILALPAPKKIMSLFFTSNEFKIDSTVSFLKNFKIGD